MLPGAAMAQQACAVQRPGWNGTPVSTMQELFYLIASPAALFLILASIAAVRFKSQWGAVIVVILWTAFVTFLTMLIPESRKLAMAEGCVGSPALFIGLITAICVAMIFYTAPRKKGAD